MGDTVHTGDLGVIDAARVAEFLRITGDRQWIHQPHESQADSPFPEPVVPGFLLVSLLSAVIDAVFGLDRPHYVINGGLDAVRFPAPLTIGGRLSYSATRTPGRPMGGRTFVELRTEMFDAEARTVFSGRSKLLLGGPER
ncbi:MaoC family dehydratase [Nocardia sp. NPDC052566]|uniref:MaoC family dehydratase n=1 Tax=Nocardia sp. NPDC052566 TaxID=3364330 RepID=UPI0037C6A3E7